MRLPSLMKEAMAQLVYMDVVSCFFKGPQVFLL